MSQSIKNRDGNTRDTLAIILGGGEGRRLYNLTKGKSKLAVDFGIESKIVDIKLTRLTQASVNKVYVLVEYKPKSLVGHINKWSDRHEFKDDGFLKAFKNREGDVSGTAESLFNLVEELSPSELDNSFSDCLVLAGDHSTNIDLSEFLDSHKNHDADVTLAVTNVPEYKAAGKLGVIVMDKNNKIKRFVEKSWNPPYRLSKGSRLCYASLLDSIWKPKVLRTALKKYRPMQKSTFDLSRDVLNRMINEDNVKVNAYVHPGYWSDVGTLDELIMGILLLNFRDQGINPEDIELCSGEKEYSNKKNSSQTEQSYISDDCKIMGGIVDHSVLRPGVEVSPGSGIYWSVISKDCKIGSNCIIRDAYLDNNVRVGEGAVVDPNNLDVGLDVAGEVVGNNSRGYICTPLGGTKNKPANHLLLQKSFESVSAEEMMNSYKEDLETYPFIPDQVMMNMQKEGDGCIEMVLTPSNKLVVSRNSYLPAGYEI